MIMGVAVRAMDDGTRTIEIVTELMAKGSLRDIISSDQWNISTHFLLRLAMDAGKGIVFLHGRAPPVVHCDVKSPNVLVSDDWHGKVSGARSALSAAFSFSLLIAPSLSRRLWSVASTETQWRTKMARQSGRARARRFTTLGIARGAPRGRAAAAL